MGKFDKSGGTAGRSQFFRAAKSGDEQEVLRFLRDGVGIDSRDPHMSPASSGILGRKLVRSGFMQNQSSNLNGIDFLYSFSINFTSSSAANSLA